MIRYSSIWLVFRFLLFCIHWSHLACCTLYSQRGAIISLLVGCCIVSSINSTMVSPPVPMPCTPLLPSSSMFTPALEYCRQGRPCAPIRLLNSQPWSSPCELWCHHELCQCHTNGHEGGRCGSCLPLEGPTIWENGVGHWTCFKWSTEMAIHRRCAQR